MLTVAPWCASLWVPCVVLCVSVVLMTPLATDWVLVGPLLNYLVSPLPIRALIVGCILSSISPLPARSENPGLGIPIDSM